MQCREFREIADSYLAEELLVETNHEILRHLETCPDCRADLAVRNRLRVALAAAFLRAPDLDARPEFISDLTSQLRERTIRTTGRWWTGRAALVGLAASVLVAISAGLYTQGVFGGRSNASAVMTLPPRLMALLQQVAREAAGDHRDCALHHRLAEAPISLADAGRLYDPAYAPLREVVERAAGPLPGGAVDVVGAHACVFGGRRFAHVVLRYRDTLVSVLVTDPPAGLLADGNRSTAPLVAAAQAEDGFHIAAFRASRHLVFVVSELEDADVMAVAQSVSGPVFRHLTGA